MIEFKKADFYLPLKFEPLVSVFKKVKRLIFILSLGAFVWYLSAPDIFSLFVFSFLFFSYLQINIIILFFEKELKKIIPSFSLEEALKDPERVNLVACLDYSCFKVLYRVSRSKREIDPLTTIGLLLKELPEIFFIFDRLLISQNELLEILSQKEETKPLSVVLLGAIDEARRRGHQIVSGLDLFLYLLKTSVYLQEFLIKKNIFIEDFENLVWWLETIEEERKKQKEFWRYENLMRKGAIASDWAAGYTLTLDRFSVDWTKILKKKGFKRVVGHRKTIEKIERILAKENIGGGVILIGEPGAGRKSVIRGFANRVFSGNSHPNLNYKRIVELDLAGIFAHAENEEMAEALIDTVFAEVVSAGNIILVIDDFHLFVAGKRAAGVMDITALLLKYLRFAQFRIIAITDYPDFHKYIEPNESVMKFFDKVEMPEMTEKQALLVLESRVPFYEARYKKIISYPALRDIVRLCAKYLPQYPFPLKAVDLLEEVMVYSARYSPSKVVRPEEVAKVFTQRTKIPVGEIEKKEKDVLLNLEDLIHRRIINQEEAVSEISEALRRARSEITIRKGPLGAFLFLGPTGVGKTETSKALAEIYFRSEKEMIRLDMSEFQEIKDINRLIGGPEQEGLLTSRVREKPFSLILLDEIEKAHSNVLNLFLQVLDEGHLTDGLGRKISFKNNIIIATSNAGYQVILEAIERKLEWGQVKKKLLDYLFEKGIFRPEFVNRFDAVVIFKPLTKENLKDIAGLMLSKLQENLKAKHIDFIITDQLKERIVELGYSPVFGAREIRRVIQDKIENPLARALLSGELKRGDKVKIKPEDFSLLY